MHMVSKKDLNSAELETMSTSRSPTTVMTANGEVHTREEATVYVKQLDLIVKVMLLEETPAVISLREPWVCIPLHQRSKKHISPTMARKLIAIYQTMCHSTSDDTPKIQYLKEVEVRVKSYGETRCINQQKPKTKIKMRSAKKYRAMCHMNCWIGYRNPDWENLVDESCPIKPWRHPEHGCQDTSSSSHELPMEPRAKVEPGSGKHSVYTHFPKDPNCDVSLKTKKNECFMQKTCW